MKRNATFFVILIFIMGMFPHQPVQAAGFSTSIRGPSVISSGQTFTVNLNASSSVPLYGLEGSFTYDSGKLEIASSSGAGGYTLTLGSKVVVDSASPQSGSFTFATITFRAKSSFAIGDSTSISLSGVMGSDGASTISGSGSSRTVAIPVPKSGNNDLASLSVSPASLSFNKDRTSYTVVVDYSVASAIIQATPADSKASVSGTGSKSLNVYENRFNIVVTAESGSKKTYTINIVRRDESGNAGALSKNNNLKSLTVEGYPLEFNPDVLEYTLDVSNLVTDVNVLADVSDPNGTLEIKKHVPFVLGENIIEVVVTAESGDKKTYRVRVQRSSEAPTVAISELAAALNVVTNEQIGVIADESGVIGADVVSFIKAKGKTLLVKAFNLEGRILYEWTFPAASMTGTETLRTKLSFVSEKQETMDVASNYAKGLALVFEENETLPEGTTLKIYTNGHYRDGEELRLYYYNSETNLLELVTSDLVVIDGAVSFPVEHTSEYLLTKAVIAIEGGNKPSVFFYLALLELLIILGLAISLVSKSKMQKL